MELKYLVCVVCEFSSKVSFTRLFALQEHSANDTVNMNSGWCYHYVLIKVFFGTWFVTMRLYVMQRTVLLSQFWLSVQTSICLSFVYCDETK